MTFCSTNSSMNSYWDNMDSVLIHIMPWLYQSDLKRFMNFEKTYSDPFIKPDEIKFYPTSVIPNTELYDLYISWHYNLAYRAYSKIN